MKIYSAQLERSPVIHREFASAPPMQSIAPGVKAISVEKYLGELTQ